MSDPHSKKVSTYLQSADQDLRFIFTKIKRLQELHQQIAPYLPANLAPHCQVANLERHTLTFIVANGAVATQLRFHSPDILQQFKKTDSLNMIQKIECKLRPSSVKQEMKDAPQNMALLSAETADLIRDFAATVSDPDLKAVMERIAKREKIIETS